MSINLILNWWFFLSTNIWRLSTSSRFVFLNVNGQNSPPQHPTWTQKSSNYPLTRCWKPRVRGFAPRSTKLSFLHTSLVTVHLGSTIIQVVAYRAHAAAWYEKIYPTFGCLAGFVIVTIVGKLVDFTYLRDVNNLPGSSKGCWMDDKGCLFTIP